MFTPKKVPVAKSCSSPAKKPNKTPSWLPRSTETQTTATSSKSALISCHPIKGTSDDCSTYRTTVNSAHAPIFFIVSHPPPESREQQAVAAQTIAEKTYQRVENLFKQGVATQQKRDEARAAYDAATAQVKAAKAQYDMAVKGAQQEDKNAARSMANVAKGTVKEVESLLEDQVLLAPCDGEVSEIYPQEGELVAMGTPIMSIAKLDDMWVSFSVREEMLNDLPMGKEVNVRIPALNNMQTKMSVYYIHDMGSFAVWQASKAQGQYDSKTFEVKMRPVSKVPNLRPGMSVILDK